MSTHRHRTGQDETDVDASSGEKGDSAMGKVLELSEETYHQLADLAQHQQRTLEEMFRLCLAAYEASQAPQASQERGTEADVLPESEYPVVLAYRRQPDQRLQWVGRTILD